MNDSRTLTERALSGIAWTSLAMGAQAILQLVALVVLARLLAPNEFGIFAAAMIIIGFSSMLSELGVGAALVQRPELEERHQRTGFTISVLFSLMIVCLVWLAADSIAAFFHIGELAPVVRAASLASIFHGISLTAESVAQMGLRFRWLASIDAAAFGFGYIIVAPMLAWLHVGAWALVGAHLTQHLVRMVCLLVGQQHPKRPLLERRTIGELLYFGTGFTLARIGNYFAGQGDNLVVGHWLGAQLLGLYTHAYQLMVTPANLFGQVLDRVLFPTMALVQLEPARLARAYRSGVAICAIVTLPASLIFALAAPEIVVVLLGPAWDGVVVPFQILALGMLFRTSYKLSDSVARATGAVYNRAWRQAVFAIAVIVGALIGQYWGLRGAAIGVVAAIILNFVLMAQLSLRLVGMRSSEFLAAHLPAALLAIAVAGPNWVLTTWLRQTQIPPFLTLMNVAVFTVALALIVCWCAPRLFLGRSTQSLLSSLLSPALTRLRHRFLT